MELDEIFEIVTVMDWDSGAVDAGIDTMYQPRTGVRGDVLCRSMSDGLYYDFFLNEIRILTAMEALALLT